MAPSSIANGTQTAVITTEHTLTTTAAAYNAVLVVDLAAMVNGDEVEIRLKTKALTAGTSREVWYAVYAHVQGQPNAYSDPVPADIEVVATLKQTTGTGRAFPWKLISLG